MKKILKKGVVGALALVVGAGLLACGNTPNPVESKDPTATGTPGYQAPVYKAPTITVPSFEAKVPTYAANTELKLAVAHNNADTTITFSAANLKAITDKNLTLANGKSYAAGDLKPAWEQLSSDLGVKITNVFNTNKAVADEYKHWQNDDFKGVDVLLGNASDIVVDGKNNLLVNIAEYLEYMPNFVKFLQDNPVVYLSLINDTNTGAMYYTPYFDGFDDIERYFMCRTDWVSKLLDGEGLYAAEKSSTLGKVAGEDNAEGVLSYKPFMPTTGSIQLDVVKKDGSGTEKVTKKYDGTTYGNVAKYMADNCNANTTGVELVNILRGYIDEAYNGYYGTKRSDLFIGQNAAWDADELVALLRCVTTNAYKLTGDETKTINGIFGREYRLDRWANIFSMAGQMFGVRGTESRNGYLYFNSEGKLVDARGVVEYSEAMGKLNELYSEGLIMQNFYDATQTSKPVEECLKNNIGFMEYDYLQTQTIYNDDVLYKDYGLNKNDEYAGEFGAILTPVSRWYDGSNMTADGDQGTYMRFTESWRSVKTSGWCITAECAKDQNKLMAAIKMFDYVYSPEGMALMSFGPDAWRTGTTVEYKGQQVPQLNAKALNELAKLAKGNYTNYARQFLGTTLAFGAPKMQAFEFQCTNEVGITSGSLVNKALDLGVIKHVSVSLQDNMWYSCVPTVLPTTTAEDTAIKGYAVLQDDSGIYSVTNKKYNIYTDIVRFGFGSDVTLTGSTLMPKVPASAQALADFFNASNNGDVVNGNGKTYLTYQNLAWTRLVKYCEKTAK